MATEDQKQAAARVREIIGLANTALEIASGQNLRVVISVDSKTSEHPNLTKIITIKTIEVAEKL